jgi:Tfp pilus assembly protein PilO
MARKVKRSNQSSWLFDSMGVLAMICVAIASVIVLVLVVFPQFWEAWEGMQTLVDRREELERLANRVAILSDYNEENLSNQLNVVVEVLPVESDLPLVVGVLASLASDFDLTVVEAVASASRSEGKQSQLREQSVRFSVAGTPDQLVSFLQETANVVPILQVTETQISWSGFEETGTVRAELLVVAYSQELVEPDRNTVNNGPIPIFDAQEEQLYDQLNSMRRISPLIDESANSDDQRDPFMQ